MVSEYIGVGWLVFGLFFSFVGVVGVIRMPDVYSRLHASGKVATLGFFGFLVGTVFLMPSAIWKVLALGLFILITGPVSTHAIAAAEHRRFMIVVEMQKKKSPDAEIDPATITVTGYLRLSTVKEISEAQSKLDSNHQDHN